MALTVLRSGHLREVSGACTLCDSVQNSVWSLILLTKSPLQDKYSIQKLRVLETVTIIRKLKVRRRDRDPNNFERNQFWSYRYTPRPPFLPTFPEKFC